MFLMLFCRLFAGYNKDLRVFDVHRPGRDFEQYSLQKGNDGSSGSYLHLDGMVLSFVV